MCSCARCYVQYNTKCAVAHATEELCRGGGGGLCPADEAKDGYGGLHAEEPVIRRKGREWYRSDVRNGCRRNGYTAGTDLTYL